MRVKGMEQSRIDEEGHLRAAIRHYEVAYQMFKAQECEDGCQVALNMAIQAKQRLIRMTMEDSGEVETKVFDISTPEGLLAAGMKEVVCTRCGSKTVFAIMEPVPKDYACLKCMETSILGSDVGVLVPWDEKAGGGR